MCLRVLKILQRLKLRVERCQATRGKDRCAERVLKINPSLSTTRALEVNLVRQTGAPVLAKSYTVNIPPRDHLLSDAAIFVRLCKATLLKIHLLRARRRPRDFLFSVGQIAVINSCRPFSVALTDHPDSQRLCPPRQHPRVQQRPTVGRHPPHPRSKVSCPNPLASVHAYQRTGVLCLRGLSAICTYVTSHRSPRYWLVTIGDRHYGKCSSRILGRLLHARDRLRLLLFGSTQGQRTAG